MVEGTTVIKSMNVRILKNNEELGQSAAKKVVEILAQKLKKKPNVVLVPSAGGTPTRLYQILASDYSSSINWQKVVVCQMDDYVGLSPGHPLSLAFYLKTHLVQPLKISKYYFLNDNKGSQLYQNNKYENMIKSFGGIDLFIHGIGENGHLGFNEPGGAFDSKMRTVELTESTRFANSRFFGDLNSVPQYGITLGLANIYNAETNIILASGLKKRGAVNKMILEKKNTQLPASVLQDHPGTLVFLDEKAAGPDLIKRYKK